MPDITVGYMSSTIASINSSGTTTLSTAGTWLQDDIIINYSQPTPNLESITINAENLLSQNTTFDSSNLVLYQNDNFNKSVSISTAGSYVKWFDSFIPINLNDKIHLYMVLSLLCDDIDETITVDCDYTVSSPVTYLTFSSSSQNSNINSFGVYYYNGDIRFAFRKKSGSSMTTQISGQIIVTKIVDGIDTITLNLVDNPTYLNIYKSLAYRSIISASSPGVSEWCNSLTSITSFQFAGQKLSGDFIFSSVNNIGQYAFAGGLGNFNGNQGNYTLTFPILTSFSDNGIFRSNRGLKEIYCPQVSLIEDYTFTNCTSLTTVSFPKCTYIIGYAFQNCTKLINASFPECTYISGYAFSNCSSLTTASFPKCTFISSQAFASCGNLETIFFPECTFIDREVFRNCSKLAIASFPKCSILSYGVFSSCTLLSVASFPLCTSIGSSAFINCNSLNTVFFPVCTSIQFDAFRSCSNLTTVSFPSCNYINQRAFSHCTSLSEIYFMGSSVINMVADVFYETPIKVSSYLGHFGSIYVPASLLDSYKTATNWTSYSSRMVGI